MRRAGIGWARPLAGLLCGLSLLLAVGAAAAELVDFASAEGQARLSRAAARADFAPLANHFEAQSNGLFCGPTSAAIVLNALHALRGRAATLPRDRQRLRADDLRHLPAGADPSLPRFTQDNVIERGAKTRAQVFGEPLEVGGKRRADYGYQLRQLADLLRGNGVAARAVVVDEGRAPAVIRDELVANLARPGDFVLINYQRKAVGQAGGGHISPLAAYDAASDSFLVLDVNPSAAPWVWMPTATLVAGMRTFDTVENRGYVVVEAAAD